MADSGPPRPWLAVDGLSWSQIEPTFRRIHEICTNCLALAGEGVETEGPDGAAKELVVLPAVEDGQRVRGGEVVLERRNEAVPFPRRRRFANPPASGPSHGGACARTASAWSRSRSSCFSWR